VRRCVTRARVDAEKCFAPIAQRQRLRRDIRRSARAAMPRVDAAVLRRKGSGGVDFRVGSACCACAVAMEAFIAMRLPPRVCSCAAPMRAWRYLGAPAHAQRFLRHVEDHHALLRKRWRADVA